MTPAPDTASCATCGSNVPRQWLLGAHHCERCTAIDTQLRRLVTWHYDDNGSSRPAQPIIALGDLETARILINQLIRRTVTHTLDDGANWDSIGHQLHLDPRDARARYSR